MCEVPYVIVPPFSKSCPAIKVSAGDGFSLVLNYDGEVFTCGKGNYGRLGQGHTNSLSTMTRIDWFITKKLLIKDICAGGRHCLAISEEDSEENGRSQLYGWGFGFYYQLGQGEDNNEDYLDPLKIVLKTGDYKVKYISCGYFMSSAITK